ncbi:erythroblast NAD(P)(+)--arginine ADP-ribosyltransferase-like [Xyrauchen texanus]|uniref:erythroblast NAD(P)(+)--arginine ADP-ribosyltransferase-like n=1 Tax=Xyrauchen texanus TaxID=154827 RepID=UPI00224203C8|nr:erythroblast NAD(P)(+)--arginine ADP-ribosyltransferase-like [Xyrauchen texanus]
MLTIAALLLILTAEVAVGQDHRVAVEEPIFNMEPNSVDDQYEGCTKNMEKLVDTKFHNKEISGNSAFAAVWKEGERYAKPPGDDLTRNHSIAIYVYTSRKVYADFIPAVQNGKQKYKDMTFRWYSLHFLLTEAIQILKKTQKKCQNTFLGFDTEFSENLLNKEIRFASFESSFLQQIVFGDKSCFEIDTCEGADLTKYSAIPGENINEVLIPPYEKFKVTAVHKDTWCKTVYVLEHSGRRSDLNCAVASVESLIHHRFTALAAQNTRELPNRVKGFVETEMEAHILPNSD